MLKIKAFAKINLGLEVLHKRSDGYHEINTVFVRTCLHDIITIEPSKELTVDCIPSLGIPQEKNLVYKAGKLLQNSFECKSKAANIKIIKNIPQAGGLAGGSSNAAATLKSLNIFWNLKLSIEELNKVALELGSDVPFFLQEGAATAYGRGEILNYFDYIVPYHILLIFPKKQISTQWAYNSLILASSRNHGTDFKKILMESKDNPLVLKEKMKNDFEAVVFEKYPEIELIKNTLYDFNAVFSLMSGSGSTVYGFFDDKDDLHRAVNYLKKYQNHICYKK